MEVTGALPDRLRMYNVMKVFPGITPSQFRAEAALDWDWLLAIDAEVARARD